MSAAMKPVGSAGDTGMASDEELDVFTRPKTVRQRVVGSETKAPDYVEFQKRTYQDMVKKITFADEEWMDNYRDCPFSSLISFYQLLSKRSVSTKGQNPNEGHLKLLIPDTIYFEGGRGKWFYTSADGYVHRTDNFTEKNVMSRLGSTKPEEQDRLVAINKRGDWQHPNCNDVQLLNSKDLLTCIQSPDGNFAVQRFVKCRGPKAFVLRVAWSKTKPAYAYSITNKRSFDDPLDGGVKDLRSRLTTFTGKHNQCSIVKAQGKALKETVELVERIVEFVEKLVRPRIQFTDMVCDFLRGEDNQWYFLQTKAFKLAHIGVLRGLTVKRIMKEIEDDDVEDDMGDEEEEKALTVSQTIGYKKLTRCKSCNTGYPIEELSYKMTLKMIQETAQHLRLRGKHLKFLDRTELKVNADSFQYQHFRVCKNCYELYRTEQKLMEVEILFARAVGIPLHLRAIEGDVSQEGALNDRPQQLILCRLLTFFHELHEVPLLEKNAYSLEYNLFDQSTKMPVDMRYGSIVPVNKLRVFYFFIQDELHLRTYLLEKKNLVVKLAGGTGSRKETLGAVSLPLQQFISGVVEKLDFYQIFSSKRLETCCLKATLGIVRGRTTNVANLNLRYSSGVYLPPPDFFTSDPLPDEWMDMIPYQAPPPPIDLPQDYFQRAKEKDEVVDAATSGAAQENSLLASFKTANEEEAQRREMDAINKQMGSSQQPKHSKRPSMEFAPQHSVDESMEEEAARSEIHAWCMVVEIHSLEDVKEGGGTDTWGVKTEAFHCKYESEPMPAPKVSESSYTINKSHKVHVRGSADNIEKYFKDNAEIAVAIASSLNDRYGCAYINVSDLPSVGTVAGTFPVEGLQGIREKSNPEVSVSVYLYRIGATAPWDKERSIPPKMQVVREIDHGLEVLGPKKGSLPPLSIASQDPLDVDQDVDYQVIQ